MFELLTNEFVELLTNVLVALIPALFSYLGVRWQIKKNNKKIIDGELCLLRTNILNLYNANKNYQSLTQLERQNLDKLYDAYKTLGGNSFVMDIYEKMRKWEVLVTK